MGGLELVSRATRDAVFFETRPSALAARLLVDSAARRRYSTAMRFLLALLICGCTGSLQLGGVGSTSNPPPQYVGAPPAPPPASTAESTPPPSSTAPAIEEEPAAPAPPPVDPALRKRARRIASQVETLLAKIGAAFTSANGHCKRVAANLRGVTARTKKSRAEIQRALADAETDAAFAAAWTSALGEISERTQAKIDKLTAEVAACEGDPDVLVAIQPLRLRVFKKERAPLPD